MDSPTVFLCEAVAVVLDMFLENPRSVAQGSNPHPLIRQVWKFPSTSRGLQAYVSLGSWHALCRCPTVMAAPPKGARFARAAPLPPILFDIIYPAVWGS